jgi:pimeloyl-ACP methyl ester carboxylesterase
MAFLDLNGHRTWVSIGKKRGPTVVLLHGGLSSSEGLLRRVGPGLREDFRVAAFDRRGHGRTADTDQPFHYADMAGELVAFLEHLGGRAHLVGHSDGGVVALLTALERPDLLRRVVVVGANYHHNGLRPMPAFPLEGPEFEEWADEYAALSPDGREHARVVAEKALTLFATEPTLTTKRLGRIEVPVLVMAGDDDVAQLAHTCAMYEAIPESQLAIVPGTSHALFKERPKEAIRIIRRFLGERRPPVTYAPLRRAAPPPEAAVEPELEALG